MKIAVITDQHFGVRNDKSNFLDNQEKFYKEIFFPTLDARGIDTVIDLGDTFDRRKYVNFLTLKRACDMWFYPLEERGIDYHCILGNHTVYYKNTNDVNFGHLTRAFQCVSLYENDPVTLDFDGTKIMLSPWLTDTNRQSSYKAFAETDAQILMGHFEIQGFEMMKGYLCDHGLDSKMFNKFDSVYSGHFHHPSSHGNITYLGAPYEMTWTDHNGKRGFHIFDTETRKMEFVENPYKMFHKITYRDTDLTVEDVKKLDVSAMKGTYIKLITEVKENPYVFDLLLEKLQNSGAADVKVVEDHQVLDFSGDDEILSEAKDTLEILRSYVEGIETTNAKDKIEACLIELYQEAQNL